MTEEDLTTFANSNKDLLAETTGLTELDNYVLVASRRNLFGRAWEYLKGENENGGTLTTRILRKAPLPCREE